MYGWINASLESMVISQFGREVWLEIRRAAEWRLEDPQGASPHSERDLAALSNGENERETQFNRNIEYSDDSTYALVECASELLHVPQETLIEGLGVHFIQFLREQGYESTLRAQGDTFFEWLQHVNEPHRLLRSRFTNARPPYFWVAHAPPADTLAQYVSGSESESESGREALSLSLSSPVRDTNEVENNIILHYSSPRGAVFYPLVVGIVRESARAYFHLDAQFTLLVKESTTERDEERGNERECFHVAWLVTVFPLVHSPPALLLEAFTSPAPHLEPLSLSEKKEKKMTSCPFTGASLATIDTIKKDQQKTEPPVHTSVGTPRETEVAKVSTHSSRSPSLPLGLDASQLLHLFPFHFALDRNLQIIQCGAKFPALLGIDEQMLSQYTADVFFAITQPGWLPWHWSSLCKAVRKSEKATLEVELRTHTSPSSLSNHSLSPSSPLNTHALFRGNLVLSPSPHQQPREGENQKNAERKELRAREFGGDDSDISSDNDVENDGVCALFLVSPDLQNLDELAATGLSLSDLSKHSFQRDVVLIGEHLKQEMNYAISLDATNKTLARERRQAVSALNAKRTFVRYVSHEIRTPLHITMLGLTHLDALLREKEEGEEEERRKEEAEQEELEKRRQGLSLKREKEEEKSEETMLCVTKKSTCLSKRAREIEEDVHETLAEVRASCAAAVDVVSELLFFERIDSGIFSLSKCVADLMLSVRRVVQLFAVQARSVGVSLSLSLPSMCSCGCFSSTECPGRQSKDSENSLEQEENDEEEAEGEKQSYFSPQKEREKLKRDMERDRICALWVEADVVKLEQLLRNLVSNALKFTARGGWVNVSIDVIPRPLHTESRGALAVSAEDADIVFADSLHATDISRSGSSDSLSAKSPSPRERGLSVANPENELEIFTDRFVRVSVADNGQGVDKGDQQTLFRQFTETSNATKSMLEGENERNRAAATSKRTRREDDSPASTQCGGSGLGLWIASIVAALHGGRLGVRSEGRDRGSTFIVDLPLLNVPDEETNGEQYGEQGMVNEREEMAEKTGSSTHNEEELERERRVNMGSPSFRALSLSQSHSPLVSRAPSASPTLTPRPLKFHRAMNRDALLETLKTKRALVVDDVPLSRKLCRKVFQQSLALIDEAENGLQAVEMVRAAEKEQTPYHLVLMDLLMPVMNGLEATQIIRRETEHPLMIVGVTGNGLQTDVDLFIAAGADHVLTKPLDVESFLNVLSQSPW